jgi:hypothetical protein
VQKAVSVGGGGESWIGFKQDLRPCQLGLMLSIEPKFSVFYQGSSVLEYAQAVLTTAMPGYHPNNPWEWRNDFLLPQEVHALSKEIKGVMVRLQHLFRCFLLTW